MTFSIRLILIFDPNVDYHVAYAYNTDNVNVLKVTGRVLRDVEILDELQHIRKNPHEVCFRTGVTNTNHWKYTQ